jgi:S1-C subfamily serine protease
MNPFELPDGPTTVDERGSMGPSLSVQARPKPPFFIVAACLIAGQFMPWIQVRIPGRELERISLFDFRGGSAFVFAFFFVFSIGMLMWVARVRSGAAITAVAVAFVGWFGVLVNVSLGALRGMIPQIGIGKIDLGRGLIGVGAGAIIVVAALLLVAMELLPRGSAAGRRRLLDGFGVAGFLLGVALAMTHTAVWVSGSSPKFESDLRLSGDSLFGSFVLSTLVWTVAIIGVLVALRTSGRGHKVLALVMVVAGIAKFFHALIFVIGKGIVNLLLPGSVGDLAELNLHWPLWLTMALSVLCVIVGFVGFISENFRDSVSRLASFEYLPSIALAVATVVTLVAMQSQSTANNPTETSVPTDSTTVVTDTSVDSVPSTPTGDSASADYISRSVVLVTVTTPSGEVCWTGSGVAVLDGTSILTNDHVVTPEPGDDPDCSTINVGITDDPSAEPNRYVQGMTIVSSDPELDLALLKMPAGGEVRLRPLSILNDRLKIDTKIRIIGYPGVGGDTITLNEGVVSGVDKRSGTEFYKVSAQISPGNSGGPMVDSAGNLVGIATAYMPADVTCEDRDKCYAEGANLGLVRPIGLASSVLSR